MPSSGHPYHCQWLLSGCSTQDRRLRPPTGEPVVVPKSATIHRAPAPRMTKMFPGLRSPCARPRPCMCSTPSNSPPKSLAKTNAYLSTHHHSSCSFHSSFLPVPSKPIAVPLANDYPCTKDRRSDSIAGLPLPHYFRIGHAVVDTQIMHEIPQVGVSLLKHYDESFQADRNRFDHVGMMTNPGFFKKVKGKGR